MFQLHQQYFERGRLVREWYQPLPPDLTLDEIDLVHQSYGTEVVFSEGKPFILLLRVTEQLWENI